MPGNYLRYIQTPSAKMDTLVENKVTEVSIVIPVKNGQKTIKSVLDAIFSQKVNFSLEVVIVDSGSTDKSLEIIKGYPVKLISINARDFNHGLSRNLGIKSANGKFVVMLTQDALPVGDNWLKNLISNFYTDEKIAGVYARQIPLPSADVLTKRHLNNWITASKNREVREILNPEQLHSLHPMERYITCYFDDVCSAIRRKIWEEIPFKAVPFGEDIGWGKDVICSGYKIVYEPEAAVLHSHNRSVLYEYRRTYICHRRLNQLFGLQTVPSIKYVWLFFFKNIVNDVPYTLKYEQGVFRKFGQLCKIPFLSFAGVLAQYKGTKDQLSSLPLSKGNGV